MRKFQRNTLLKYIPDEIKVENIVNEKRIYYLNKAPNINGEIIYLCEREIRVSDNFALNFALQKSKELNLPLKIIIPKIKFEFKLKNDFISSEIHNARNSFFLFGLNACIFSENEIKKYIKNSKIALLVIDFNPILNRSWLNSLKTSIVEIDGHNICAARYISNKQEYSAATFRPKVYKNIHEFLTKFPNIGLQNTNAINLLNNFISTKLPYYVEYKNNPEKNVLSGLSKYLNLGFISSQRVALEVLKANVEPINKETFLEELIIRKELADNFCLFCKNFKDFSSIPTWAKTSLNNHSLDIRPYLYSLRDLENAKTHDKLWNAAQIQLLREGVILGYLRMYWAKKILEWTRSQEEALETAIYLNDKYALDSPSPNGYVGILWAIGGLHDRAFQDYPVTGKIRRMTSKSIQRKYKIANYINRYV